MRLHRLLANEYLFTDLLVCQPLCDQSQNLQLSPSQNLNRIVVLSSVAADIVRLILSNFFERIGSGKFLIDPYPAALDSLYSAEQGREVDAFENVAASSSLSGV